MKLHATRNDLPEATRTKSIQLLNERLADTIDLALTAKQAHWNVKGPSFYELHLLFDKVAEEAHEAVDEIAERITALGGTAEGTSRVVHERSTLPDYPLDISRGSDHVKHLADSIAAAGKKTRAAIDQATEFHDADTADLFTQASRTLDQYLWFVEAHGQAEA